jgi:hypothetical protein
VTIADVSGRVLMYWDSPTNPPKELCWDGKAMDPTVGRARNIIYNFKDSGGSFTDVEDLDPGSPFKP